MTTDKYILDGRTPVPCEDLHTWARWYEEGHNRRVAETRIGDVRVSTVFLGLDHQWGDGPPLLFETMIFGGDHHGYENRYSTWEEAERGHDKAIALVNDKAHKAGAKGA